MLFWHIVIVTLSIKNTKDEISRAYGGKVMNGQSCRFRPFDAVKNKALLAAHSRIGLSGRGGRAIWGRCKGNILQHWEIYQRYIVEGGEKWQILPSWQDTRNLLLEHALRIITEKREGEGRNTITELRNKILKPISGFYWLRSHFTRFLKLRNPISFT